VSALSRAGRLDNAERRFDVLCGRASALALYREEFAATGMLGHFRQAFTHLALTNPSGRRHRNGPPSAIVAHHDRTLIRRATPSRPRAVSAVIASTSWWGSEIWAAARFYAADR
jgi:hypothetical protein